MRVLEYLWKAAEDLHPTLPEGHASRVVADLNAHARARPLHEDSKSAQLPALQRAIACLNAKQPYLA
ncbi:hypothetical protein [Streptomyces sp900116325]|uniref:Uncharacterized protein n=1 Tax=Streptomyces sp. 900116325 TaxID=3154295 RepID=A0ABV2UM41_9ACTN